MSSIGRNQTDCTNASCSILCALISPFNREGGNEKEIMRLKNYDKRGKENRTCGLLLMATYAMEISLLWKLVQTKIKKSSKLTKKITHADDMMIHNLVTYLFSNSTLFVRYKNNKFLINHLTTFCLEICYFYILQTKTSLDKMFYKVVYHHIIYMFDFFGEFRRLFCLGFHEFSQ